MNATGLSDVICFGGEDWWYHNRAHADIQLMRRFARQGRVLYVNSIIMRKPNVGEGRMFLRRLSRKLGSLRRGLVEAEPRFHVYSPVTFPVHHVPGARQLNQEALRRQIGWAVRKLDMREPVVWVACPAACDAALRLARSALAYQRTDRYEEFPGVERDAIRGFDGRLKAEADVTFYVNRKMMHEEEQQCKRAVFLDHGVDYDLFASAEEDPAVPEEMQELEHPVVGFFGGIDDHTSDIALVTEAARRATDMTFVFVGSVSADVSGLRALPNVQLLGRRPYEQVPHYGKCFDVAIMPWRQNRWIEACNPIKLKEYLALGKPVVSTPFSELAQYDGLIYRATDPTNFVAAIRKALAENNEERRAARRERVKADTWDAKAEEALGVIGRAVARDACGTRSSNG
jgi:glycosyltransferase involved in cell wall biosynthesis